MLPDARIAAVQKLAGQAHNVIFTAVTPPPEIFRYYREDLKSKGYQLTQEYQAKEQSFLSFKKGQLVVNIVITRDPNDPDRSAVAVMYQVEEEVEEF